MNRIQKILFDKEDKGADNIMKYQSQATRLPVTRHQLPDTNLRS